MVMVAGQQPRLLLAQPALRLEPGALRAHPMATGVVPHPFHMPIWTGLHMPPKPCGTTRQDRPHGPTHMVWQRMAAFVSGIASLQDLL
jgi:hypothetical protein